MHTGWHEPRSWFDRWSIYANHGYFFKDVNVPFFGGSRERQKYAEVTVWSHASPLNKR